MPRARLAHVLLKIDINAATTFIMTGGLNPAVADNRVGGGVMRNGDAGKRG